MAINMEFSEDQFKDLLKLVYLGNWVANGIRTPDNQIMGFMDINDRILNEAYSHGFSDVVGFDEKEDECYPTEAIEDEMDDLIDEYEDLVFWQDLIIRMTHRDFVAAHGEDALESMPLAEREKKLRPLEKKYEDEFFTNGVDNLELKI
jgi:hypothetical protein